MKVYIAREYDDCSFIGVYDNKEKAVSACSEFVTATYGSYASRFIDFKKYTNIEDMIRAENGIDCICEIFELDVK